MVISGDYVVTVQPGRRIAPSALRVEAFGLQGVETTREDGSWSLIKELPSHVRPRSWAKQHHSGRLNVCNLATFETSRSQREGALQCLSMPMRVDECADTSVVLSEVHERRASAEMAFLEG